MEGVPAFSPARSAGILHGDPLLAARELMKCMFQDFQTVKLSHFRLLVEDRFLLIKFHSPIQRLGDGRPLVSVTYLSSCDVVDSATGAPPSSDYLAKLQAALTGSAKVKDIVCTAAELQVFLDQLQPSSHAVHSSLLESSKAPAVGEGASNEASPLRASMLCLPIYGAAADLKPRTLGF